jgi:hypothetical protein
MVQPGSTSPFDWVKSINEKNHIPNVLGYNPFLTNIALSYSMDSVMLANEMNQYPSLPALCQYDFLYASVRKSRRFNKWYKEQETPYLEQVMSYFSYSKSKALEALQVLTQDQLRDIMKKMDTGGQ